MLFKSILYRTVNLINKRFYIGVHTTSNINDNYLGSGWALTNAIKKYGRDNFKREILGVFSTKKEAYEFEEIIVNDDLLKRVDCYNICKGGDCGPAMKGELNPFYGITGKNHPMFGRKHSKRTKEMLSGKGNQMFGKKRPEHSKNMSGKNNPYYGKTHSDKVREKMSGENHHRAIAVIHTPTGKVYPTMEEASNDFGLNSVTVRRHCNNKVKDPKFEFINEKK